MVVLAAACAVFVLAPLRRPASPPEEDGGREQFLQAREVANQALRDTDFDHATGKISDADYADFRARYEAQAQSVLGRLDAPERPDVGQLLARPGGGEPA